MSTEENKTVVRRFYEAWNEEKLEEAFALVAPDYNNHAGSPETSGREGFKRLVATYHESFSNIRHVVEDVLAAEGNNVISRVTVTGLHTGPFMGMPATGKQFAVAAINILRVENGMLVEHWEVSDALGLMQQLGVIPAPEQAIE